MSTEDDAFVSRARQKERSTPEVASFGLAMTELTATDPVPLSGSISAVAKKILAERAQLALPKEEPVVQPLVVPKSETG